VVRQRGDARQAVAEKKRVPSTSTETRVASQVTQSEIPAKKSTAAKNTVVRT